MARPDILDIQSFQEAFASLADAPLCLAITDLDYFSLINEQLGHSEGDRVLKAAERLLSGSLPSGSLVARLGGDEYGIILPESSAETALILFDEIIKHFQSHRESHWPRTLSMSVGLAARPSHANEYAELMRAADEALLRAKKEGRARVCIYVENKMSLKSNYYSKSQLEQLSKLASAMDCTEASLLRKALDDFIERHRMKI